MRTLHTFLAVSFVPTFVRSLNAIFFCSCLQRFTYFLFTMGFVYFMEAAVEEKEELHKKH